MKGETNWSGNIQYQAHRVHRPTSFEELRSVVAAAPKIHAIGSRHSFNGIADSAELVSLEAMPASIELNHDDHTVSVGGGVTYGDLALAIEREGFALHNMASLPHISVAGAVATATHGSGDANGNLATAVAAMELVTSDGNLLHVSRADEDFAGMVVGLGALGVVTRLTLDVQPSYWMRQQMYEQLEWDVLHERFDDIMSSADSVSLFTDYGPTVNRVLRKERVDPDARDPLPDTFMGAPAATGNQHPMAALSGDNCTTQRGVPGKWLDRLPHFRTDAIPSVGEEIQSEYVIPRRFGVDAIKAIRDIASLIQAVLQIAEIRTVASDDLWLSTAYNNDIVCLHFTWTLDPKGVERALHHVEDALAPFEPRPHWGKLFLAESSELESRYERLDDFRRLADRLDPRGAFRNAFLRRHAFA